MLILTRKVGEKITIGNDIEVTVIDVKGRHVRLGIDAPNNLPVHREEVYRRILEENVRAASSVHEIKGLDELEKIIREKG